MIISDTLAERDVIRVEKVQKDFSKKMIRFQSLSSTLIIMIVTAAIFVLHEYAKLGYDNNKLDNIAFKIACALIMIQSFISMIFVYEMDVLSRCQNCTVYIKTIISGILSFNLYIVFIMKNPLLKNYCISSGYLKIIKMVGEANEDKESSGTLEIIFCLRYLYKLASFKFLLPLYS